MAKVRPFTEAHAIVRVECGIAFEAAMSEEQIERFAKFVEPRLEELGFASAEVASGNYKMLLFSTNSTAGADPDEGLEAAFMGKNVLGFRFNEYRGWSHVVQTVLNRWAVLRGFIVESEGLKIRSVGLEFFDRFVTEDPEQTYDFESIFDASSPYLAGVRASSNEAQWESRHSWFSQRGPLQVLSTLNIDARPVANSADEKGSESEADPEPEWVVVTDIEHRQQSFAPDLSYDFEAHLPTHMEEMHDQNLALMSKLLNAEMRKRVGLEVRS